MPLDQPDAISGEMPFLDHLEELRWRIVKSVAALAITFAVTFSLTWFNFDRIMGVLIEPVKPLLTGGHLVYTHPMGLFTIIMQVSGVLALVLSSPVVGYQVWNFLSPALHERERKIIVPVLGFAALLFMAGVALAVLLFVPMTVSMLKGISAEVMVPMITAEAYFGFIFFICLAFGATFEMPVLALILTALGLLTPQTLGKMRRWAAAGALVLCMIITPGDAVTATVVLWVPVYGLYEFSILVSWFVHRARLKRKREGESIGEGATA